MRSDAWQRFLVERPASPAWLEAGWFVIAATAPAVRRVGERWLGRSGGSDLVLLERLALVERAVDAGPADRRSDPLERRELMRTLGALGPISHQPTVAAVSYWLLAASSVAGDLDPASASQRAIASSVEAVAYAVSRMSTSREPIEPLTQPGARFRLANSAEAVALREHAAAVAERGAPGLELARRAAAELTLSWERRGLCDPPGAPS